MALFKKLFNENILFTKKSERKYKLVLNLEKKDDFFIISYLDDKIKHRLQITEKCLGDYEFIQKTKNVFYKKYRKLTEKTINEMVTADAGVGSTAPDQFSSDFYAPGDARNLFGTGKSKFPMTRRPKITDTLTKKEEDKPKKKKKKKIVKESYFMNNAIAYIFIEPNEWHKVINSHIDDLVDLHDLDILSDYQEEFDDAELGDSGWDEYESEWIIDYKHDEKIWFIVVDLDDKQVYVRPNYLNGNRYGPSSKASKEIKDWAIEHGYDPKFKVDIRIK